MKKEVYNFAVIGLGHRGVGLMKSVLFTLPDVKVIALCDSYDDRPKQYCPDVKEKYGEEPFLTTNFEEVLKLKNIDAVLVSTSWEDHLKVACRAMEEGIAVAMEVGASYSEEELWHLVDTWERTKTPFMFMENCCFDKHELMATKMARDGFFGEIVHMAGSYSHDLRKEISSGNINRHYRLRNYIARNCDNYPTHEIGPIAKILNINRGNRFVSLVSIASKSRGLHEYIKNNLDTYKELENVVFNQGDVVNTLITCENGETIAIKLDTTLPRSYNRNFTVEGTKAMYEGATHSVFVDGEKENYFTEEWYKDNIKNGEKYEEKYLPDFWKTITNEILIAGHGGMDYFEFRYFVDCLKENKVPLLDVYDAATWMIISVLSEKSIKEGGTPQKFPDFTRGAWKTREPKDVFDK